jgi:hypothetical protein
MKNYQVLNLMKIRPGVAELCHACGRTDRQTDMTKQIVAFRIDANARYKSIAKQLKQR